MNELQIGTTNMPDILKNPFLKTCIKKVAVSFEDFWGDGNFKARGSVDFKNGDTSGCQQFTGKSFDDVVIQIKAFIETLTKTR